MAAGKSAAIFSSRVLYNTFYGVCCTLTMLTTQFFIADR